MHQAPLVVAAVEPTQGELRGKWKVGDVIVNVDPRYFPSTAVKMLLGGTAKAKLGWTPTTSQDGGERLHGGQARQLGQTGGVSRL